MTPSVKATALTALAFTAFLALGCTEDGKLRPSTEESSRAQLEAAASSGFPTEIMAEDEVVDAEELLAQQTNLDPEITYLVLTRTDAQIVWGGALRDEPPIPEEAILGPWVAPYLKLGDRDEALKAFVFGYLGALHSAGRIEWDCAIVPFLPAEKPGPIVQNTYAWGILLTLLVMLAVFRSAAGCGK